VDLLGAPQRGRGEVLVGAGLEFDVALLDEALGLPQRLVEAAERRAAVAGDVAGRVEAGGLVALALHHGQPHQGLGAREVDPAGLQYVFVVQGYSGRHETLPDFYMGTVATESCAFQSGSQGARKKTFYGRRPLPFRRPVSSYRLALKRCNHAPVTDFPRRA
jgi:hypothetical protein